MLLKFIAKSIWFTYVLIAVYIFMLIILNTLLYNKMNIEQVNRESINKWLSINFSVNLVAMTIALSLAAYFDNSLPDWILKIIHKTITTIVIQISNSIILYLLYYFDYLKFDLNINSKNNHVFNST